MKEFRVILTFSEKDKPSEIESKVVYECWHCGKVYSNHLSFVKHVQFHEVEEKQKLKEIEKSRTKDENVDEVSIFTNKFS